MDIKEVAAMGGKAKWKGKSRAERKAIMEKVRAARIDTTEKETSNS